jgi:hypothetical protein
MCEVIYETNIFDYIASDVADDFHDIVVMEALRGIQLATGRT